MKNFKSLKITLFIFSLVLMPLSFFNHTTYAKEDIALDEQECTNFTLSNINYRNFMAFVSRATNKLLHINAYLLYYFNTNVNQTVLKILLLFCQLI